MISYNQTNVNCLIILRYYADSYDFIRSIVFPYRRKKVLIYLGVRLSLVIRITEKETTVLSLKSQS